jgi:hypothetical protein
MKAAGRAFSARCSPRSAALGPPSPGTSSSTTGTPADAASAAMPLPMVPAPTTPTFRMRMRSLSGMAAGVARPGPRRGRPRVSCDIRGGAGLRARARTLTKWTAGASPE